MNYTYYPNGTRHTVSTPTQSTTHTYDDLNRLETVTVDGKQTVYTYYDSGQRRIWRGQAWRRGGEEGQANKITRRRGGGSGK